MGLVLPAALYRLIGRTPRRRRKGQGVRTRPVPLSRARIFILPTRLGLLFALLLLAMLLGSINYNSSLGFALTFLLAGMGFIAILHTYRNLVRLEFSAGKVAPVFVGEAALFSVVINNPTAQPRYALVLQRHDQAPVLVPEAPAGSSTVTLSALAPRRGVVPFGTLTVSTRFPLGLFCAWSQLKLEGHCLVYPRPGTTPPVMNPQSDARLAGVPGPGQDDFAGQRGYRPGDALSRVNWKAAARGQGLLIKEFAGDGAGVVWLTWEGTQGDGEARLSQLCRGVLDADAAAHTFGLRLPDATVGPGTGLSQRQACLGALALCKVGTGR